MYIADTNVLFLCCLIAHEVKLFSLRVSISIVKILFRDVVDSITEYFLRHKIVKTHVHSSKKNL